MKLNSLFTIILAGFSLCYSGRWNIFRIDRGSLIFEQAEFDNVANTGILVGYQFDNWAIEGIYNTSSIGNDILGASKM